jgi:protein arginine kinase activator
MLCDKCKKNEATVHIKEFHNNKCTDLHLCQECAGQHAPADLLSGLGFNLADVLMNVDKIASQMKSANGENKEATMCPVCKWTADKIAKHDGKLGCPECYKTFATLIKNAIAQVQRGAIHLGKRPRGTASSSPAIKQQELENLKKELQRLIASEEYEAAALCRDRINALNEELNKMEDNA